MKTWSLVFIALGLSMDAFAVAITSGIVINNLRLHHALVIASAFGGFQALMPFLGWLAGWKTRAFVAGFDHWIAFGLLLVIGGKMIANARTIEKAERPSNPLHAVVLLTLALATSMDALAVGLTFAFLDISIVVPIIVIGGITFAVSFAGVFIGDRFGHLFENKMEIVGGLILIGIGIKILVSHLLA